MSRNAVTTAKRVVIKIGSSSLTGTAGSKLDSESVSKIADLVASLRARGAEVLLVSSGAIAAGLAPLGLSARPKDLATQQAAASVGQGLLIAKYNENFSRHNLISSQVLLTTEDVVRRSHYQNAQQTLNKYDAPPSHSSAKAIHLVDHISDIESIEVGGAGSAGVGSGGMVTKIEAARISTSAGIPMLLTSLAKSAVALTGEESGTFFAAHGTRSNSRLLWLAHASTPRGRLILDAGAVTAIKERGFSLLPAGVTAVEGDFISGDTVELVGVDNKVIARGLVAFDSDEIPQMLGRSTKELAASLGAEFERELVHRDDLVLLG